MEWLFEPWEFMSALGGPSGCPYQGYDEERRTTSTSMGGRAELSAVEMWVLRLSYQDLATELNCGRCGFPLGRELHTLLPSGAIWSSGCSTVSWARRRSSWRLRSTPQPARIAPKRSSITVWKASSTGAGPMRSR
jgi:hypothetical protein